MLLAVVKWDSPTQEGDDELSRHYSGDINQERYKNRVAITAYSNA